MWPFSYYFHRRTRSEFHEFPPVGENRIAHQWYWMISIAKTFPAELLMLAPQESHGWWDRDRSRVFFLVGHVSKPPPTWLQWVLHSEHYQNNPNLHTSHAPRTILPWTSIKLFPPCLQHPHRGSTTPVSPTLLLIYLPSPLFLPCTTLLPYLPVKIV